ncbi:MAG: O-antigen ligase family protein [Solirubrobacterales bacterium]
MTSNLTGTVRGALGRAAAELPLAVVALVLIGTGAEIMPPDALLGVGEVQLTLQRLLIVAGFIALVAVHRPSPRLLHTGLTIPLILLLGAGLVATLKWGGEPRYRFLVEAVALLVLTVGVARTRRDARVSLTIVAVAALALSALTGLAQVAQHEATGFYRDGCLPVAAAPPEIPGGTLTRATGTFANPNLLAGHLLLLAPLAALVAATAPRRGRLVLWIVASLGYVGLALTLSRAAVALAIASIAIVALTGAVRRRGLLAAGGVGLALLAGGLLGTCGADTASGSFGRVDTWEASVDLVLDNPLTGVGLGRTADVLRSQNPDSTFQHAHNLWLTWWVDAGTVALLAWLAITAVLLWAAWKGVRAGDQLSRALLVSLVTFFAFSLLDHPANVDRVALAFWVVAGLTVAGVPRAADPPADDGEGPEQRLGAAHA